VARGLLARTTVLERYRIRIFSNSAGLDYGFNIGDDGGDLSTALDTETLAARDMVPDEFKVAAG
jgi:hypothetical protein